MKIRNILIKAFWMVFSISMLLIMGIAMSKPLNNQFPGRLALYTFIWTVFYCLAWIFCCFLEKKAVGLKKWWRYCLPILLTLFGVALFTVSCLLRSDPITDYGDIYEAAQRFALGQEVENWEYFAIWYNNVGAMLVLAILFKLGSFLPVEMDCYYFALFVNVLQVLITIACLSYLAGKGVRKHSSAASYMAVIMGCLWIPIWANTSIFYSDQLSFGAAVFGLTLLVKGAEKQNLKYRNYYVIGAGICFGVGSIIKVTSATIVIALFLGMVLFGMWRKYWKQAMVLLGVIFIVLLGYNGYCKSLPYQADADRLKAPVEYWIAVGLGGNGTYADNEEFANRCLKVENMEERRQIARQQIAEQLPNLWNVNHIVGKLRQNFGCGDLGAAGYLIWPREENALWHWFSQEGERYWTYAGITTAAFFAVLFIMGAGGIQRLFCKEYKSEEILCFIAALAFWGLCLFLMLWEAQDKQMYNHSGWMILSLVYSLGQSNVLNKFTFPGHKILYKKLDISGKTH